MDSDLANAGFDRAIATTMATVGGNTNTVRITAADTSPTSWSRLFDHDFYPLYGLSAATESLANVEISLVLDISSSMASHQRLEKMKAASTFVDTVLGTNGPNSSVPTTVSVIPYSMSVSVPEWVIGEYAAAGN